MPKTLHPERLRTSALAFGALKTGQGFKKMGFNEISRDFIGITFEHDGEAWFEHAYFNICHHFVMVNVDECDLLSDVIKHGGMGSWEYH